MSYRPDAGWENGNLSDKLHAPRILLAKIGLDGHDRGVKVLARAFRDAGMDVIYTGLWQTCQATMNAAMQEDVDVVGVSLLSATHMTVMPELMRIRSEYGIEDIPVVLGGIVPDADHDAVMAMGVAEVFNPGSSIERIIECIRKLARGRDQTIADCGLKIEDWQNRQSSVVNPQFFRDLARILTTVQRRGIGDLIRNPQSAIRNRSAIVIGITGAPGVGKSSFIAKLSRQLCSRGQKIGVVAVDPTSPVTGGALLGDRLRMMQQAGVGDQEEWGARRDSRTSGGRGSGIRQSAIRNPQSAIPDPRSPTPEPQFFVRSLSSGSVTDGLGPHCKDVVAVLGAFGFDYVLVETVGAGQADVGIRTLADKTLLILMPETGDAIQFSKAGITEIADAFVINKCDLPGADATQAQLVSSVGGNRPVWQCSSQTGEGIAAVADWVVSLCSNS